ncbi:MAG: nicotinamide-nucleotide amidase [Rhodothermales bacterium]|jgi:nicotinamide-nucleotide amidase
MSLEILSIGSELLLGHTLNSNFCFAGELFAAHGIVPSRETCVHDEREIVCEAVQEALSRVKIVLTIGGLGPTRDDLSREAVADALGVELQFCQETADLVRSRSRNRAPNEKSVHAQAHLPSGAVALENSVGTAPGLWCEHGDNVVVMLPGPPREFQAMLRDEVLPRVLAQLEPTVVTETIRVYGLRETDVEMETERVLAEFANVSPAYCVNFGRTDVRVSVPVAESAELAAAVVALRDGFGDKVVDDGLVDAIACNIRKRGWTFGTAESCTGGGIAACITELAGISDVFAGSAVTYSNEMKQVLLGVPKTTLDAHGAVSEETATAMLRGLCERLGVQAGVAVTGIAGPGGGTPEKPVGLVYIGSIVDGEIQVERHQFSGDRESVRGRIIMRALNQLRCQLARHT